MFACSAYVQHVTVLQTKKETFHSHEVLCAFIVLVPRFRHMWGTFPTISYVEAGAPQLDSILPTCHDEHLLLRTGSWWCEWAT